MFLNITEFKKFLKSAYKGSGLIVGSIDEHLVLMNASGTWGVQITDGFIPNKLKAAMVELIGDLPEEGEVANYQPEGIQNEMDLSRFNFYEKWKQARDYAAQTPFILRYAHAEYILMQIHSTMELCPINRTFTDLISIKDLDHAVESMPGRPCYLDGTLYWKNDTMIYWAGAAVLSEEFETDVLPKLSFLDCFENEVKLRDTGCLPFDEEG